MPKFAVGYQIPLFVNKFNLSEVIHKSKNRVSTKNMLLKLPLMRRGGLRMIDLALILD